MKINKVFGSEARWHNVWQKSSHTIHPSVWTAMKILWDKWNEASEQHKIILKEKGWVEGLLLAITAIIFKWFTYSFRLSVSIRRVASDCPFYALTYIWYRFLYIWHLCHVVYYFVKTHFQHLFLYAWRQHLPTHLDLIDVDIRAKGSQLRMHIHTKIHKQKTQKNKK